MRLIPTWEETPPFSRSIMKPHLIFFPSSTFSISFTSMSASSTHIPAPFRSDAQPAMSSTTTTATTTTITAIVAAANNHPNISHLRHLGRLWHRWLSPMPRGRMLKVVMSNIIFKVRITHSWSSDP